MKTISLHANQLEVIGFKESYVRCLSGTVWVTNGEGGETCLTTNQTIRTPSGSKTCILAFTDAVITTSIEKTGSGLYF
jgi:environmental stress-induced protein Ves